MNAIGSLLYALIFYPATALWCLAGVPAAAIGQRATHAVVLSWVDLNHWLARHLLGIETRVEGVIPPGQHLFAVKHQSMLETIEIARLVDLPVIVLKRELADLPLFGWMTRSYGVIPVDREAGAKALKQMVAQAKSALASGRPVVIFPEGTRVPPGARPPLKSGFAALYRALGLPVVPIAVDSGRLWGRGLVKHRGTVRFRVGETIPPGLKREEMEARVHAAINALDH